MYVNEGNNEAEEESATKASELTGSLDSLFVTILEEIAEFMEENETELATFEMMGLDETIELVMNLETDPFERVLEVAEVAYVTIVPVLETTT